MSVNGVGPAAEDTTAFSITESPERSVGELNSDSFEEIFPPPLRKSTPAVHKGSKVLKNEHADEDPSMLLRKKMNYIVHDDTEISLVHINVAPDLSVKSNESTNKLELISGDAVLLQQNPSQQNNSESAGNCPTEERSPDESLSSQNEKLELTEHEPRNSKELLSALVDSKDVQKDSSLQEEESEKSLATEFKTSPSESGMNQSSSKHTAVLSEAFLPRLAPADKLWTTHCDGAVKLRMEESGVAAIPPLTVHQMFLQTVEKWGDRPALATKQNGQWQTISYQEYYRDCRKAAKSFLKLGLERYHGVGILGFNSPEWFIADIGAILAGGFAVGIYTTNSPEACEYVAQNCAANVIVVENHRQLVKIQQIQNRLPHLKAIVQYKDELMDRVPNLYSWKEFMELGKDIPDIQLDSIIDSQKANQCCTLIYTSGTTGQPKAVMLSHDNLTWISYAAGEVLSVTSNEAVVTYLPLSHVAAQVEDIWIPIKYGATTYFADPDALKGTLVTTMKEVQPTGFLGVPRVWEKMQEKMKATSAKSSLLKRKVAQWARGIGLQVGYNLMNGDNSFPWGFMLANNLVFKKVRTALGLEHCTKCYTGAAPITKDTLEFFMSLYIPVLELYGMSENTGPHTISLPHAFKIMSCGKVIPGCKTLIHKPDEEGNGEICMWGRHVFMGYLNMEDKTKEALDEDGWLHTGDLGKHDSEDFLYITGRIKELIITAGGENIPPVPIEDAVKEQVPIISNAMLIGDKCKFLSMLLTLKCNINAETGEPLDELTPEAIRFCRQVGSNATKVSEIVNNQDEAVYKAIQTGVDKVNKQATSNAQKVQKWSILLKDFSIAGGELGPTMKLKRPVVVKMYKDEIAKFYLE